MSTRPPARPRPARPEPQAPPPPEESWLERWLKSPRTIAGFGSALMIILVYLYLKD